MTVRSTATSQPLDFGYWYKVKYRDESGRLFTRGELHEAFLAGSGTRSETESTNAAPLPCTPQHPDEARAAGRASVAADSSAAVAAPIDSSPQQSVNQSILSAGEATSRAIIGALCEAAIGLNAGWSRANAEWLRDLALKSLRSSAEEKPVAWRYKVHVTQQDWFYSWDRPTHIDARLTQPLYTRTQSASESTSRNAVIDECINALAERLDSLRTMTDRAGYTREGNDLAQRTSATYDAIQIIRNLKNEADRGANDV